jgi:Family of unknown function (DUF6688)
MIFFAIPVLISLVIALPGFRRDTSLIGGLRAVAVAFFGVTIPLLGFLASGLLVPEWKGACPHGWIDCFETGKLTLTPLVLWATTAFYSVELLRVKKPERPWIVLGLFSGTVVSGVCLLINLFFETNPVTSMGILPVVPLYVFAWYLIRTIQVGRVALVPFLAYLATLAGSIPLWIASVGWMKHIYRGLPDRAPECFVVTAAGRGHRQFVGPFFDIERHGCRRQANRQLVTLWELESLWRDRSPGSHAVFRRLYNTVGPVIAAQIRSPWLADTAYVAIKPVEIAARWINQTWRKS